jgi:hypothetical protein
MSTKYLRVGGDANNPKDYENCSSVGDCQRHVHVEKIKAAADAAGRLVGNPSDLMDSLVNYGVTPEAYANYSGKLNGAPTVVMQAKVIKTGAVEDMTVIDSQLTMDSRPAQSDVLVRIPRDEARFMDADKKTAALGYAVMGNGFKWGDNMVTYNLYAEDPEYLIYDVTVE